MVMGIKKGYLALVMFLMLVLMVGCSSSNETSGNSSGSKDDDKVKIGVTIVSMKTPVYQVMKKSAEAKAKELGVELIWQSAEFDPQVQLNQIQNFVTSGVDAIVIEPADDSAAHQHVKLAKDAGIPVVNLEYYIKGADTDLRIVGDSVKVGELQVNSFIEEWGDKPAKAVILSGTSGSEVAESITKGNKNAIEKNKNIELLSQQYHNNWDQQLAMNTMENMLVKYKNDIQVVFANNDSMIMGAYKAAQNAGVADKIIFYGSDNNQDVVEEILKDAPIRTVDKGAFLQGERIIEGALKVANEEEVPYDVVIDDIPVWYTPISLVNKDNLDAAKGKFPELFK